MTKTAALAVLVLAIGLAWGGAGCAKNDKSSSQDGAAKAQADAIKHRGDPRDNFEASAADPPINAETRFAAGQLAESQGDIQRAVAQYKLALKTDPNHRDTLFRLAALYTEQRQFDDAVPLWQHYVQVTRQSPDAYNDLALCYEQAGNLAEAEQAFKAGIARNPDSQSCRLDYGLMLARAGRLDEAIAQLQTVLKPAEVHYNLGSIFEQQGKIAEAKAYYRRRWSWTRS
jgi:tetratricopeptide (TPR) repeat protein